MLKDKNHKKYNKENSNFSKLRRLLDLGQRLKNINYYFDFNQFFT